MRTENSNGDPTRRLSRRYLLVLTLVASLIVLDQAAIQPALVRLNFYAPVINVAGRQRMLSQRLTKAALAIETASQPDDVQRRTEELRTALGQWSRAHAGLQRGDDELGLPPTESEEIQAAFARLQPHFEAIAASSREILEQTSDGLSETERNALRRHVDRILESESQYLPTMDQIVGLYEWEARNHVARLRLTGVTIMASILLLLGCVGLFVLRPATRLIRRQVEELQQGQSVLEERVAERTRQLSETNAALEQEIRCREEAQRRSRELQNQLTHAARITAMGQLATGLAHELNQPLGAIANFAETSELLLEAEDFDRDRVRGTIDRIRASALRAGRIIRRMRGFVQRKSIERRPVELNAVVSEVVELCQPELHRMDVEVQLDLGPVCDLAADRIGLQQVLVNLIQNSIQAMQVTARDGRRLAIVTACEESTARVEVCDTGPGFPFDPDLLTAPFSTTKAEGLGMGLSISRTIIEEHGGRFSADSRPGQGARVGFLLPIAEAVSHELQHADV